MYIVGVSDEALHSNEVFPKATDEHKGEDSDKVDKVDEVKRLHEGEFFFMLKIPILLCTWINVHNKMWFIVTKQKGVLYLITSLMYEI